MGSMDAKEFEILQKGMMKPDMKNPVYTDYLIQDAIGSMKEKLKLYGTSRDPSEFTDPPAYSNPTTYKDFTVIIVKYKNKFSAMGTDTDTGKVSLQTDWFDTVNEAGKQIFKYIHLYRKQFNPKVAEGLERVKSKLVETGKNKVKIITL